MSYKLSDGLATLSAKSKCNILKFFIQKKQFFKDDFRSLYRDQNLKIALYAMQMRLVR